MITWLFRIIYYIFFFFFFFFYYYLLFCFLSNSHNISFYLIFIFNLFYTFDLESKSTLYNVIVFPYSVSTTFRFLISRVSYRDITALREIWDPSIVEMVVRRVTESSLVGGSCAQTLEYLGII